MSRKQIRATGIGAIAITLWSSTALFTTYTSGIPPLQLSALAFFFAFLTGMAIWFIRGVRPRTIFQLPSIMWLIGVGGLFGYHALYYTALKTAPVAEANLINYLWPLLIVVFSSLLPGERLRWYQASGALIGFTGVAVLITGGQELNPEWRYMSGYLAALGCAVVWAAYSVLSRRFGMVPSHSVALFCGLTAMLSWGVHLIVEDTAWPSGRQWLAVAAMGVGPTGLAFLAWDHGVKHGNIKRLGVISFFTPLFSTFLLIVAGRAAMSSLIALACLLIISGAVIASGVNRR